MTEIKPPPKLVEELGNAYKNYQIEIKELIALAYLSGYNNCAKDNYSDIDLSWLEPMRAKTKQLQIETEQLKKETLHLKEEHFYLLCKSLLNSIDSGNQEAEESVLCRIRVAVCDFEHIKDVRTSSSS